MANEPSGSRATMCPNPESDPLIDQFGRRLYYLRISITDRCNYRCVHCVPSTACFKPHPDSLTRSEIERVVQAVVGLGIYKIRLTGGEPTIFPELIPLVRTIAHTPGITDLSLTTNGHRLARLAQPLAEAGLDRVNVSLDSLDPERFRRITRGGNLERVWAGIQAAEAAGLTPIKLNTVVMRGYNDQDIVDLVALTLEHPWHIRFIEVMPLGGVADFSRDVYVSSQEILARISAVFGPLTLVSDPESSDPARLYRLPHSQGAIGLIQTVSHPFCEHCSRLRLTADGKLRLCLLRDDEVDLLPALRGGATLEELRRLIAQGAYRKPRGHDLDHCVFPQGRVMSQIGG